MTFHITERFNALIFLGSSALTMSPVVSQSMTTLTPQTIPKEDAGAIIARTMLSQLFGVKHTALGKCLAMPLTLVLTYLGWC